MNQKRSARICLILLVGLLIFSIGSVLGSTAFAYVDTNNDSVDDLLHKPIPKDSPIVTSTSGTSGNEGLVWQFGRSFLTALFGDTIVGEEMLSRIFMTLLIGMFVYTALQTFFDGQEWYVKWGATIAATALAIIGLPENFLVAIRVEYGAMGAAILSAIPFLIILWFTIKADSPLIARITWLFFLFYYFALYISKIFEIYVASGNVNEAISNSAVIPYYLAMLAGVFCFFFVYKARAWLWNEEMKGQYEKAERGLKKARHNRRVTESHEQQTAEDIEEPWRPQDIRGM